MGRIGQGVEYFGERGDYVGGVNDWATRGGYDISNRAHVHTSPNGETMQFIIIISFNLREGETMPVEYMI